MASAPVSTTQVPAPIPELLARLKAALPPILSPATKTHKEISIARAPGRLDVMGGIADYTGSVVCELPIDCAAAVAVQRRDDHRIIIHTFNDTNGNDSAAHHVELSMDDFYGTASLLPVETLQKLFEGPRRWAAYFGGAFPVLAKHKKLTRRTPGANIVCYSTVPIGAGLASSAAITCAALTALTDAYHLILDPLEIAVLAQKVEQQIAGGPCGVMDQVTAMVGRKDQLLLLRCQPHEVKGYAAIPEGFMFAGIASGVKHSVGGSHYRRARLSAFIAHEMLTRMYVDLGIKKDPTGGYLANIAPDLFTKYFRPILPEQITGQEFFSAYGIASDRVTTVDPAETYFPRAAAAHHILENARVQSFAALIADLAKTQDVPARKQLASRAGALMLESHASYSANAGLGSPQTDLLVELVMQRGPAQGFHGAKITGGGDGGTVAILAESSEPTRSALAEICADYEKRTGRKAELITGSSAGAIDTGTFKIPLATL